MEVNESDYRWLTSEAAGPWLARGNRGAEDTLTSLKRLRRDLSTVQAGLVVETWELRRRAHEKFSASDRMFFTRRSLQQATEENIALYKARRFPLNESVWDLCCGIGGDLWGLVARGPVIAVDQDPVMVILAEANVRVRDVTECRFLVQDVQQVHVTRSHFVHIDPDRRPDGARVARQVADYEPGREYLEQLLVHSAGTAMKLAPAAQTPGDWESRVEREWITARGECRQQVVWSGTLTADPGTRRATRLGCSGTVEGDYAARPQPHTGSVALAVGDYIHDPDPSLLASGLLDAFARDHGLSRLHAQIGYLTGERRVDHPLISSFRVIDSLPLDRRRVTRALDAHGIGRLEVKKRGVELDPVRVARWSRDASAGKPATLLVAPTESGVRAILALREAANPQADARAAEGSVTLP